MEYNIFMTYCDEVFPLQCHWLHWASTRIIWRNYQNDWVGCWDWIFCANVMFSIMRSQSIIYFEVYVLPSYWVTRSSTSGRVARAATTKERIHVCRKNNHCLCFGCSSGYPAGGCRSGNPLTRKNANFEIFLAQVVFGIVSVILCSCLTNHALSPFRSRADRHNSAWWEGDTLHSSLLFIAALEVWILLLALKEGEFVTS